jgi:Holliday junction resolvasome RuvABC ATP-dependent DNA helicase subunit
MRIRDIHKEIIGQRQLLTEVERILRDILIRKRNHNIIVIGSSGTGKSHLIKIIANVIGVDNCMAYHPDRFDRINKSIRFHMIDEIHELKSPERLYPLMDTGKYTFIFSTNEYGNIKEPLLNRCITLQIEPYSDEDMVIMVKKYLGKEGFFFTNDELYKSVAAVSRDNPRRLIELVTRLSLIFRDVGIPNSIDELDYLLMSLGVDSNTGMTQFDKNYLEFLSSVDRASLSTISSVTGIDKSFIVKYIEPFLIKNGYISITSRGRIYVHN